MYFQTLLFFSQCSVHLSFLSWLLVAMWRGAGGEVSSWSSHELSAWFLLVWMLPFLAQADFRIVLTGILGGGLCSPGWDPASLCPACSSSLQCWDVAAGWSAKPILIDKTTTQADFLPENILLRIGFMTVLKPAQKLIEEYILWGCSNFRCTYEKIWVSVRLLYQFSVVSVFL